MTGRRPSLKHPIVLADIGGTYIRFATHSPDGKIGAVETWLTAFHPSFLHALHAYRDLTGLSSPLDGLGLAVAGPVVDGRVTMTNQAWVLDAKDLAQELHTPRTVIVNDFAAIATALPQLTEADMRHFGGGGPKHAPKLVLGPGTGLGVAAAIPCEGGWTVLAGEGGHVDLAPQGQRELSIVYQLQQTFGHLSAERVLSGPGLENLVLAIAALDGVSMKAKPRAEEIVRDASKGDHLPAEAVSFFCSWLGAVAGNAALTLGAHGGVYLTGGVIAQMGDQFDARLFRHRFESKGRMRDYLAPIPAYVITAKDIAFRGLAHAVMSQKT
jgi:glucokinase